MNDIIKPQLAQITGEGEVIRPDGTITKFKINGETDLTEDEFKEIIPDTLINEEN